MFDYLIRGGMVVDGTGRPAFKADVAVKDGRIAAVGEMKDAEAREVIDATGKIVTPGFIDIHTHYDGQVTWDDTLNPSFSHGVTTIVMGNCSLGFAPVRKGQERLLIELMESVEDIPGVSLAQGIPWGWESFPQFLDHLAARRWTMDVAAQVPHGAVRVYVMGERGQHNEDPTAEDRAAMAKLVGDAIDAGAVGFSTSRYFRHRGLDGECVPGTYAKEDELMAIGRSMAGKGAVFQVIGGGKNGPEPFSHEMEKDLASGEHPKSEPSLESELKWMAKLSKETGVPVTMLYSPGVRGREKHQQGLAFMDAANAEGARLRPQTNVRPVGLISGFQLYHIFMRRPSYMAIADLPFEQRLAELNKPEVKTAILAEADVPPEVANTSNTNYLLLQSALNDTFPMGDPLDFEPSAERSIPALAAARGVSVEEEAYDQMLKHDGRAMLFATLNGYRDRNLDEIGAMVNHPGAIVGGSDGGAHVRFICDAALPTFALVHWVRDRTRGAKIPLESMVRKLTMDAAELYGFEDRGRIKPGLRADLNVIDLDALTLDPPHPVFDLPAGSMRLLQDSHGYAATLVNGQLTRRDDRDTGARPGRLLRGRGAGKAARSQVATAAE